MRSLATTDGRGDLVYFTWGSRLYWAMQAVMMIAGCLLLAKGFGNLLFAFPFARRGLPRAGAGHRKAA